MECRICIESSGVESMITPCDCSGSMKYVHRECLLSWINSSHKTERCDICLARYKCRIVAIRPNFWQWIRFLANTSNVFLLALMVLLQFFIGIIAGICGLIINVKRVSHCLRIGSAIQMFFLCFTSLCLTATLIANFFWFYMFCVLMAEVVTENWRQTIVYTIKD